MSLAQIILPPPTPHGMTEWSFAHNVSHLTIIQAAANLGYQLQYLTIWPIPPNDIYTWLQNHQALHDEMNAMANVIGNDLQDIDFNDKKQMESWHFLNFNEHRSVYQFLGQGI